MSGLPKIDKNIPIPHDGRQRQGVWQVTFAQLKVGDSVLMNSSQRPYVWKLAKKTQINITTRDTGDGQFRCWRIK